MWQTGTRMAQCSLAFLKRTACLLATPLFNTLHVTRRRGKVNTAMRRTGTLYPSTTLSTLSYVVNLTKSLLTDSRAFAGTLLDSDHRLLIAQLDLSRLYWSEIAQPPSAKHARYNTEQLASGPIRTKFRGAGVRVATRCQPKFVRMPVVGFTKRNSEVSSGNHHRSYRTKT